MRTIVATVALLLSGLLGYAGYALHQSIPHHPPGIPVDYTEHLLVIGRIGFAPPLVIGSTGIAAALFFALAIYLLTAERG
jgi:hypothetical protein